MVRLRWYKSNFIYLFLEVLCGTHPACVVSCLCISVSSPLPWCWWWPQGRCLLCWRVRADWVWPVWGGRPELQRMLGRAGRRMGHWSPPPLSPASHSPDGGTLAKLRPHNIISLSETRINTMLCMATSLNLVHSSGLVKIFRGQSIMQMSQWKN